MIRLLMVLGLTLLSTQALAAIDVVTTLPEYAAIAQEIGGDKVKVISLTKPGQDPHFVDAKPSYIIALNKAELLIVNGLDLEIGWIPTLLVQARNPNIQPGQAGHMDASTFAGEILDKPSGHIDRSMGDIHGGGNPHFSRDPTRMVTVIEETTRRLAQLEPASAATFQANSQKLLSGLKQLINESQTKWSKLPAQSRQAVEYHKSWLYLFDTLQITVPIRIESKPGVAPSPAHVAKVVGTVKSNNVKLLLQETSYSSKLMSTVAKITKSKHIIVSSGPDFDKGQGYIEHVQNLLDTLYAAVQPGATP